MKSKIKPRSFYPLFFFPFFALFTLPAHSNIFDLDRAEQLYETMRGEESILFEMPQNEIAALPKIFENRIDKLYSVPAQVLEPINGFVLQITKITARWNATHQCFKRYYWIGYENAKIFFLNQSSAGVAYECE